MIGRRSLMAMIGLAPVAAVSGNYLSEAVARVEREVKLSLAPEWVRRFM